MVSRARVGRKELKQGVTQGSGHFTPRLWTGSCVNREGVASMGGREPRLGIGMRVGVREIRLDVEYGRVIDKVNASDMEKRTGRGGIIHIDEAD